MPGQGDLAVRKPRMQVFGYTVVALLNDGRYQSMAKFYPFRALRPVKGKAGNTACLPYDVLSYEQAKELAVNAESFIHVIKSEADLPEGTDLYSDTVYQTASDNLAAMCKDGVLVEEEQPAYYIYREISPDHTQTGVVGTVSCREYEAGIIKRHELTVAEKEDDRTRHILTCRAQTGLVFLTFDAGQEFRALADEVTKEEPSEDFVQGDVRHQVWPVTDEALVARLSACFDAVPALYIADGHHRAASSCRAARQLNADDSTEAGRFMAAAFPADDLSLLGYHRIVHDLNGLTEDELFAKIRESFDIKESEFGAVPLRAHQISMWINGKGYYLEPHEDTYDADDSVSRLDVSILQNQLLDPILGIRDPRRDKRISFIGGMHAAKEIKELTAQPGKIGFLLYPTSIHDLMSVADDGRIMPPKSTWFEPKLLSGLFVHRI